jgi:hypothetical protein
MFSSVAALTNSCSIRSARQLPTGPKPLPSRQDDGHVSGAMKYLLFAIKLKDDLF